MAATPPVDEDDWSHDEWLAWLADTAVDEPPPSARAPRRAAASTFGQSMLAAGLVGLHEALYGPREEQPALIVEASGPGPDGMEVHLDEDDPKGSWVRMGPEDPPAEH